MNFHFSTMLNTELNIRIQKLLLNKIILLLAIILLVTIKPFAQVSPLPPGVQAIMFSKIFYYINSFEENNKIKILILYDPSVKSGVPVSLAFEKEKLESYLLPFDQLPEKFNEYPVIYLMQGVPINKIKKTLRESGALIISGDPALVQSGDASISVGLENDKPKIIINLTELQKESHQVSAELVNLAKVYK